MVQLQSAKVAPLGLRSFENAEALDVMRKAGSTFGFSDSEADVIRKAGSTFSGCDPESIFGCTSAASDAAVSIAVQPLPRQRCVRLRLVPSHQGRRQLITQPGSNLSLRQRCTPQLRQSLLDVAD